MKRILFVDDDSKVLDSLRRLMDPQRAEWQISLARSGSEALEVMSREAFDVVVTDVRMPGMDGTELLAEVRERHPQVVRIVLSEQADRDLTLRSAALAHQYLSKPHDADILKTTIERASALKDVLNEPALKTLVASVRSLPSVPALYTELVQQLESPESDVEDVANVIAKDTAMTAKILQLANSAFFGIRRRINNPKDAVLYLGFDTVKALTLTVKVFSQFRASVGSRFSVEALANHSVSTGALAREIAKSIGVPKQEVEDSFMAGLLHDVGKLVLVDAFPGNYDQAIELAERMARPVWEAEQAIFGTTHARVGTYLFWMWGLPDAVVEAVAYHHLPSCCPAPRRGPLTAVHVANALSHSGGVPDFDVPYLEGLGLAGKMSGWHALLEQEIR